MLAILALLGACGGQRIIQSEGLDAANSAPATAARDPSWRYVRFRLRRPDNGDAVASHLDLLLADRVLSPLIDAHRDDIPLWRFHRRWADDATGHQFSFVFLASDGVAATLTAGIESHPLLDALRQDGHLIDYRVVAVEPPRAGDPAATSDPRWPESVQREWPVFIMGASRMWLGLVRSEAGRHADKPLHARYRAVERTLDTLWYEHGNHALLHHLSALFGYRPLRVIRRDDMTF